MICALFLFTALLFSATFRKKIERLARDILVDPIRVVQGDIGEASDIFSHHQFRSWNSVDRRKPCTSWNKTFTFLKIKYNLKSFFSSQANEDITQVVELLPTGADKWSWLTRRLVEFTSTGSVLIFVTKKANSDELATNLIQEGYSLGLLHGDMDQSERNKVITDFKKKNLPVLVATDVAGKFLFPFICAAYTLFCTE